MDGEEHDTDNQNGKNMSTGMDEQDSVQAAEWLRQLATEDVLQQCLIDYDGNCHKMGTGDLVAALMELHEKMRWMLGSSTPKH